MQLHITGCSLDSREPNGMHNTSIFGIRPPILPASGIVIIIINKIHFVNWSRQAFVFVGLPTSWCHLQ